MYPINQDSIVAFARGVQGEPGELVQADLDAVLGGVVAAGNTLAKLYALDQVKAPLNDVAAFTVSPTVPTLANGNVTTKVANSAFVHQELVNYALPLGGGTLLGPLILAGDPTGALGAATKQYVDAFIQGIAAKYSATCATAATLPSNTYSNGASGVGATLTATANGALSVDGQSPTAGQYVLVKNETSGANNGLYQVTQAGDGSHPYILTRAVDDDTAAEMAGAFCFVELGTVNNKTGWLCGQSAITIGTTAITFTQFSGVGTYTAGTGLSLTGSQFAIADAELLALVGLTSAADTVPYFTGLGTAALASFTAFARTFTAVPSAAAARTVLALGTSSTKNVGASVLDPGTGNLEALLPIQTVTGASKVFATADLFMETRRSNAGAAMTDTFPPSSATGLVNGSKIIVTNVDATASDTITPGAGTTISGTGIVGPGRAIQYVYDLAGTIWRPTLNTGTALLGPNNLSDVSSAATARTNLGAAPLASPAFTGTPTAPTPAPGTNTTQLATSAFVQTAITALIGGAPGALDTLKELADAINDDASYAATITAALALKLPLAGGTMAGGIAMGGNNIAGIGAIAGGSGTTGTQLTFQTTTGNGTTDAFAFKGGNAGATTFATLQTGSFNLQSGSTYSINGAAVLSGSALGSGVTSSSLTSLGTITSLTATTINAFTQGGNISGGGFQHNNVIIGAGTPLAGTFTTLAGTTSTTSPLHYGGSATGSTLTINGTSNGSPSSAFLALQSNGQNVGIGNTSPKTFLDLNENLSSSPALAASTSMQRWQSADGASGGVEWVSYGAGIGGGNILTGAVVGGTAATPLATPANRVMINVSGWGHNGTALSKGGIITMYAPSLWSGSNQATQIDFYTTPQSSTALALAVSILPSGGLAVGTTSDPGTGMIYTNAATFMTRTKTSWSSGAAAAAGTLANAPVAGNPTKWIPVDDNGTTRYIPAW
jgi:hypothetical protein